MHYGVCPGDFYPVRPVILSVPRVFYSRDEGVSLGSQLLSPRIEALQRVLQRSPSLGETVSFPILKIEFPTKVLD